MNYPTESCEYCYGTGEVRALAITTDSEGDLIPCVCMERDERGKKIPSNKRRTLSVMEAWALRDWFDRRRKKE